MASFKSRFKNAVKKTVNNVIKTKSNFEKQAQALGRGVSSSKSSSSGRFSSSSNRTPVPTSWGFEKQAERDTIRRLLEDEGDTINVPDFANKVKAELLPLNVGAGKFDNGLGGKYENIALPDELRGPVGSYRERVYESPIKTSAGFVHNFDTGNYFAHSRIEDLPGPGNKGRPIPPRNMSPEGRAAFDKRASELASTGDTRRVIEIQNDLFQKGRLEGEKLWQLPPDVEKVRRNMQAKMDRGEADQEMLEDMVARETRNIDAWNAREKELSKLEPYRNTWHERIIREEVKQVAKDGKTKLQFPTGETAMKIEGLGETNTWATPDGDGILPTYLKVGREIVQSPMNGGQSWIITNVLGDGKFKAVPSLRRVLLHTLLLLGGRLSFVKESLHTSLPKEKVMV